jgi:hypothetical protein
MMKLQGVSYLRYHRNKVAIQARRERTPRRASCFSEKWHQGAQYCTALVLPGGGALPAGYPRQCGPGGAGVKRVS